MPGEAARAHPGPVGQGGKRQVGGEVLADPGMEAAEPVVAALKRKGGTELGLPAGPLEEHDEVTRHGQGHLPPEIGPVGDGLRSGRLPAYQLTRRLLFKPDEVEALIADCRVGAAEPAG